MGQVSHGHRLRNGAQRRPIAGRRRLIGSHGRRRRPLTTGVERLDPRAVSKVGQFVGGMCGRGSDPRGIVTRSGVLVGEWLALQTH